MLPLANLLQLMPILETKSCNQLCIRHQAMGAAIKKAIPTRIINSFEKR
jgi:hypothetical protein